MKREDIDKKIGMPDVDKEWTRFEREVIGQPKASRKPLYWGIGIAASIALVAGIFLFGHGAEEPQQTVAQQTTPSGQPPSEEKPAIDIPVESIASSDINVQTVIETKQHPSSELLAQVAQATTVEQVYDCGEISPQFPGGESALKEFIKKNLKYPDLAMEYGAKGRVIMNIKIDSMGYVSGIKVLTSKIAFDTLRMNREPEERQESLKEQIKTLMGEESTRILSLMPQRWTPGSLFGKNVSVSYAIPIIFNATNSDQQKYLVMRDNTMQGRIAGLTIVSSSDDLGPNNMRRADCPNTQEEKRDSVLVVVNGQPIMKEEKIDDLHQYFFDRHQLVDSIRVMRDETYRAIYGEQGKNSQVIVKITTTPFTPVSQLTPDQLKERRLAYLLDSYRKGFTENTNRECFTPDLYDTPMEERLFGLLTQQYGRLRREYFGPVGSDTHGVYVPLIREAVMVANDHAWMDGSGKIITNENSPQLNQVLSEIDQAASQADKHIQRTDSFMRKAFIYGGTVAEGEPRTLYSNIWRFAPRGLWESTFHFVPNPDAPSFWCGEVYRSTSGQRHVIMHLHSVDKLYAADCPEILNNRRRIAGTVLNEQDEPLADIIVSMVGSAPTPETVQVRTDSTGHFELWLPFPDATIEVGHVGYLTTRLLHPADTTLVIRMKDATKLRKVKVLPKEEVENYQGIEMKRPILGISDS